MKQTNSPRVLYLDIETTPIISAHYHLGKQHVNYDQILKRPQVMVICWAWGDGKVQSRTFNLGTFDWYSKDDESDKKLLEEFIKVANEADLLIGHNAKKFDIAVLRSRLIRYGLPNIAPTLVDDTWLMTKEIAFTSHKLDDLGDYLDLGRKKPHGTGMEWWIAILRGDKATLTNMAKYCAVDVERLRSVYKAVKPYTRSALNMAVFTGDQLVCPSCGSKDIQRRGYTRTTAGTQARFQCKSCGSWSKTGKNLTKNAGTFPRPVG